ncbi:hypothetical protein [Methylomonas sp. AM2-LC]|uniref:hypothetical protein n=1 Tax=Methylomonas sp. AM2-LC TaxID=3153301 RepID=UPI00326372B9
MHTYNFNHTLTVLCAVLTVGTANASLIDFDSIPLSGPGTYAAAGATIDLTIATGDINAPSVSITGGTVLTNETFLPANSSSLYGTAFFGTTFPAPGHAYSNSIVLTFANPISNFFMDVYNGQVFNVTYTVSDNNGHSSSFLLAPNLNSGTSQIGFAAAGSVITVTSDAGSLWDFSIDNIGFNQALPTSIPTQVQPTPPSSTTNPPITLVAENQLPPELTLTPEQRQAEGLDNQKRRGRNGNDFRIKAQGFDDANVTTVVPLPSPLVLFGTALSGLTVMLRKSRKV